MHFSTLSFGALAVASGVTAGGDYDKGYEKELGYAKVVNKCKYPVFLYSVGYDADGPYKIECDQEYVEKYWKGGVALEIFKKPDEYYSPGCKKTVFYYKLEKHHEISYDLYDINGDPFDYGEKIVLFSEDKTCPVEVWPHGHPWGDKYDKKTCDDCKDTILVLCEDEYKDFPYDKEAYKKWEYEHNKKKDDDRSPPHPPSWEDDKPDWDNVKPQKPSGGDNDKGYGKGDDKPDWDEDHEYDDCHKCRPHPPPPPPPQPKPCHEDKCKPRPPPPPPKCDKCPIKDKGWVTLVGTPSGESIPAAA